MCLVVHCGHHFLLSHGGGPFLFHEFEIYEIIDEGDAIVSTIFSNFQISTNYDFDKHFGLLLN